MKTVTLQMSARVKDGCQEDITLGVNQTFRIEQPMEGKTFFRAIPEYSTGTTVGFGGNPIAAVLNWVSREFNTMIDIS